MCFWFGCLIVSRRERERNDRWEDKELEGKKDRKRNQDVAYAKLNEVR